VCGFSAMLCFPKLPDFVSFSYVMCRYQLQSRKDELYETRPPPPGPSRLFREVSKAKGLIAKYVLLKHFWDLTQVTTMLKNICFR